MLKIVFNSIFKIVFLLVMLISKLAIAGVAEDISNLKPGEWYEIPNSKLSKSAVLPDPLPPGNSGPVAIMSAWSGGAFDTKRDRLLIWGGGHADYAGNEIYAFDMNNFSWSRIWGPTPNNQIPMEAVGYNTYEDGNPSSRHTYNSVQYIPELDLMWNTGGAIWKSGSGVDYYGSWLFDLKNLKWEMKGQLSKEDGGGGYVSAYDPVTGHIFSRCKYGIFEYDTVDGQWTKRYKYGAGWWSYPSAAIDPVNRKMLMIGQDTLNVFDLETYALSSYQETDLTGDTEILRATAPGFEYDPVIKKFVAWSGEPSNKEILPQTTYLIDPATLAIEKVYPASTNSVIPTSSAKWGTYGRFRYVPSKDVFIVVNSIDENVYVYKLSNIKTPPPGFGSTTKLAEPRIETNIHSIGIEWDIEGDDNHNAASTIEYRIKGAATWKDALPLFRIDHLGLNMMAGSIMFLNPGTTYQVRLDFNDPDGGTASRTLEVTTRIIPALPTGGRTFHVVAGSGGGDGSEANPFKGIDSAQNVAQPGDIFLLHAGDYGERIIFDVAGNQGKYIVWKASGDGAVNLDGIQPRASYTWFEGLNIKSGGDICPAISPWGDRTSNSAHSVVVANNTITGGSGCPANSYLIRLSPTQENWTIIDNVLIGDVDPTSGTLGGEGIELWHSSGHTIAYNSISRVADGISYPGRNVDIFGNDIFDVADDGIEPDYGYPNTRIWGNRITNALHNAISLQDLDNGVPWYIIRNQIINYEQSVLKTRMDGRFVFLHNTVVNWDDVFQYQPEYIVNGYVKNNLIVSYNGGEMWNFSSREKNWRTDIDYNGFDWGSHSGPFYYASKRYSDLGSYSTASGLDKNSIEIDKTKCFENLVFKGPIPELAPRTHLTLKAGCNAIDSGTILPNINDGFLGSAPDLGVYESGAALPHYGTRTQDVIIPTYETKTQNPAAISAPSNLRIIE